MTLVHRDNKGAETASFVTKNLKKLLGTHVSSTRWYLLVTYAFSFVAVYYFKSFYIKQGIREEYKQFYDTLIRL